MSPTLLEGFVALVLLIVAWQIGVIIAPLILYQLRAMRHSLDEVSDDVIEDTNDKNQQKKEHLNGSQH